jgi:dephospho-CoA kinase
MPVLGITGGIASGKSTAIRVLKDQIQSRSAGEVETFSADCCAHALLENDLYVQSAVVGRFGNRVLNDSGVIDRALLRQVVFADATERLRLEAILHPKIREIWIEMAGTSRSKGNYFLAEIPLLYETDSDLFFDCIIVVEADAQVQLERLSSKRGWSLETARRVIEAQMPTEEKRRRADILISNHHTEKLLTRQVQLAASALLMRYA